MVKLDINPKSTKNTVFKIQIGNKGNFLNWNPRCVRTDVKCLEEPVGSFFVLISFPTTSPHNHLIQSVLKRKKKLDHRTDEVRDKEFPIKVSRFELKYLPITQFSRF